MYSTEYINSSISLPYAPIFHKVPAHTVHGISHIFSRPLYPASRDRFTNSSRRYHDHTFTKTGFDLSFAFTNSGGFIKALIPTISTSCVKSTLLHLPSIGLCPYFANSFTSS